jgi:hypothetical protein
LGFYKHFTLNFKIQRDIRGIHFWFSSGDLIQIPCVSLPLLLDIAPIIRLHFPIVSDICGSCGTRDEYPEHTLDVTYGYKGCTFMATPRVSGGDALVKSINKSITALQIKDIILSTMDAKSFLTGAVNCGDN